MLTLLLSTYSSAPRNTCEVSCSFSTGICKSLFIANISTLDNVISCI